MIKCVYCHENVAPKKSNVLDHLKTVARFVGVKNMTAEGAKLVKTVDYFRIYFEGTHAVGETLDEETLTFRVENMEMMLISGAAIEKLDSMRPILERHAKLTLTSSSNIRQLVTPTLRKEIDGEYMILLGRTLS